MDNIEDMAETVIESWFNGQKKQAAQQLFNDENFNDLVDEISNSDILMNEEKIKILTYFLKYNELDN